MDMSGFYKLDGSGELLHAPNFVYSPKFSLTRKEKDKYKYPVEGWKWFDSEGQARIGLEYLEETITITKKEYEELKNKMSLEVKENARY